MASFTFSRPPLICIPPIRTRVRVRFRIRSRVRSSENSVPESITDEQNGKLHSSTAELRSNVLKPLYDDGSENISVRDYLDVVSEMIRSPGGPPRWFFPLDCGRPIENSPVLMFLPGVDGVGLGLVLHHKSLGKVFKVRCLHVPVYDCTPFEGLVKFVEDAVKLENAMFPNMPIYLVGDSFGGCLALSVAARNPTIDLILILSNPATSFGKSLLQPLLPILESLPDGLHMTVPYLLSFIMGDAVKMAMTSVENGLPPLQNLCQLPESFSALLLCLLSLSDIISKDTLLWKLKLLRSAASYTNSCLHAVKAEVLVLASGKDNMLPSTYEAERLWTTLQNCRVRYFVDHGHTLLSENGINLLTIVKGSSLYRRSGKHKYVSDYLPPTLVEFEKLSDQNSWLCLATSPVMFSTLEDGKIVRGLAGVPNEGPVLLVGYHMFLAFELYSFVENFLREKNIILRGIALPSIFSTKIENCSSLASLADLFKVFGALPVSANNLYQLFSTKSFILLYPGGAREAGHRKGEDYKLFWPDQPEFVRMAAHFGATIVPFGVIGEDDMVELVLDYNDQMNIPFLRDLIAQINEVVGRLRTDTNGEVANQDLHFPLVIPKIPGRIYYLFGKPIKMRGSRETLKDKEAASALYLQIKSEVESLISYLKKKREEDPFRFILQRILYQTIWGSTKEFPTFEP